MRALVSHWHDLDRQVRIEARHEGAGSRVGGELEHPAASEPASVWVSRQSETVGSRQQLEAVVAFQRERFGDDGAVPLPPSWAASW